MPQTGKKDKKDKLAPEVVTASPELNRTSTVVKQFVVDYTSETFEPLMEYEVNGLEYRYIYGNDRLSVNITGVDTSAGNLIENGNQIRLYYHMDYLGTADYLTSPMTGKVESWTHYNEWGEITHNAVLKFGQRELDMVKRYATHDYDSVIGMYYAKARFYDAEDRRFVAIDPILDGSKYNIVDYVKAPAQLVQYLYVRNNPVIYIDPDGLRYVIDDLDPYGAYSKTQEKKETEKRFDYRHYRQEHEDIFIDGIASAATTPEFSIAQVRDYNKKIKKCDNKNNSISAEGTCKDAATASSSFKSMDEAASDFVMNNNPLTHVDNKERGTYIYKVKIDGKVKYTYLESPPGGHDNVIFNAIIDYKVGLVVKVDGWDIDIGTVVPSGFVHTHPSCEYHIGETFSNADKAMTKLPGISTVYLGTPNGMLYRYNGKDESQSTVSSSMPKTTDIFINSKTK